ncbi:MULTISPECIES: hypothetical protein [Aphanizomenon]|jgi:hypothetical protein|uniref:hypothetical protein n=1 Tax=Aphanizomenon TaxID=1175 RepID=UPI000543038E|nr:MULTISPECIES: hypothetical protein [Aphanizomenon]KHG39910.1 hypothetical protein OA07_20780 [Aphanizomenon flos-aquae 2012/KM1/D3]KHG40734.1 hypothetical protein OA07_15720 [Aphanizomenon flos-aquae 2012/KM1/D3]MTJ32506.1 hypothetical protein [Aphanizomenon sp. UHCC 0183]
MNYQKEEFESKNLDHLGIIAGIIAGIIDEIEIVEKINEIFLVDSRLNNSFPDILRGYQFCGMGILWLTPRYAIDRLSTSPAHP